MKNNYRIIISKDEIENRVNNLSDKDKKELLKVLEDFLDKDLEQISNNIYSCYSGCFHPEENEYMGERVGDSVNYNKGEISKTLLLAHIIEYELIDVEEFFEGKYSSSSIYELYFKTINISKEDYEINNIDKYKNQCNCCITSVLACYIGNCFPQTREKSLEVYKNLTECDVIQSLDMIIINTNG